MRAFQILALAVLLTPCAGRAAQAPSSLQCRVSLGRLSPDADRPLRLAPTDQRPELIHKVNPVLPEIRQPLGIIVIESIIDRRGRVCAARLLKGSGPIAEAFLKALKEWRFKPAMRNGKPVPVFYDVTVNFDPQ